MWNETNTKYWDSISNNYEHLYNDNWSMLENKHIQEQLCKVIKEKDTILDLGCGLGLGYELIKGFCNNIDYTGVDISRNMVEKAKSANKNIKFIHTTMSNLIDVPSNSIDVVISIFTSFSFTNNIQNTITEIKRVLKKNGKIFISVLSKWSLRRMFKMKFGNPEKYLTRKTKSDTHSYSWVFTKNSLKKIFKSNGFTIQNITGYNAFVGFAQINWLWKVNLFVSRLFPNLSHDLIIIAKY